jgi:valyl-tRNA synthetase
VDPDEVAGDAALSIRSVAQSLYEFTWNEFCDWFLNDKPALSGDDKSVGDSTRHTPLFVLERCRVRCNRSFVHH